MKSTSNYTANSITILKNLEAVRKRPGMYIGSTDNNGLHHLLWEIVDNAVDEALVGYCSSISVVIHDNYTIEVTDNGRGIPLSKHASGKNVPELIFTTLHAGGKFDDSNYMYSGGLHGVGASVVNALSSRLEVEINRNSKQAYISFHKNGLVDQKLKIIKNSKTTGTRVKFTADPNIFINCKFQFNTICTRMEEIACLNNNLTINVQDLRANRSMNYCFKNGLLEFLNHLNKNQTVINEPILFSGQHEKIMYQICFQYNTGFNESIISFANNIKTILGGTHENGFKSGIAKALSRYAFESKVFKEKDRNFDSREIKEGLTAIITIKIPEKLIQFEGQTKSRLGTPAARTIIEKTVRDDFYYWLQEHNNQATAIVEKILQVRRIRAASKKARQNIINNKSANNMFIGKLTPARSKKKLLNELFLVEGDSAEGSAKSGRNSQHQAILPLRGKIINAEKTKPETVLQNNEIKSIIASIGAGYGIDFNINNINYGKIIIMTDADTDGAHIQVLLLIFFYRYMRELFKANRIYLALPPLFKITFHDQSVKYAWTESEYDEITKDKKVTNTQRYKGLGEMNSDQLWETTMNPETRKLIQVSVNDILNTENIINILMSTNSKERKIWINENIDFNK